MANKGVVKPKAAAFSRCINPIAENQVNIEIQLKKLLSICVLKCIVFKVLKLLEKTKNDLLRIKPDILITIDSPDFNFRILKKIHKILPQTKKVHYVAPTVWAWRSGRAKYLSKYINKLLTILPFEKRYFSKYNLKTEFVGHPVFELSKKQKSSKRILEKYNVKIELI